MVNAASILKEFNGTRTVRLLDAIVADDIHTWNGLKEATDFSEEELNYHLAKLYEINVLSRKNGLYYLRPEIVEDYHNVHLVETESVKHARESETQTIYRAQLPSLNPKKAGERKKKLRGE